MRIMRIIYTNQDNPGTPQDFLSIDEDLLAKAEAGEMGETLRFWESAEYFVVAGRGEKEEETCYVDNCKNDGIKILKRISGGGTVLQGPGSFNYSLILSYDSCEEYRSINSSYKSILSRIADGFKLKGYEVDFLPISDLVLNNKKISGNAQARKKKFFLQHGTFLINMDLKKIDLYIKHPPKEPEYRKGRPHSEFVTNIPVPREEIKGIFVNAFAS